MVKQMTMSKSKVIDVKDLKDVQRWMRHFNISKEELFAAVEKFGPSAEAISLGMRKGSPTARQLN
jgi:hypothetical protein